MENQYYQKQAWRRNRSRIIKLLNKEPLSFTQLIQKSRLSRAIVNNHLKVLEKDGLIKKVYDSKSRKILNLLQLERLDLVEWFVCQLENFDMPQEILNKGRKVLSEHVLLNSAVAYSYILNNTMDILGYSTSDTPRDKKSEALFMFKPISSRLKVPEFQSALEGKDQQIIKMLLSDLTPHALTVVLTEYEFEKSRFQESQGAAEILKELKKRQEFFFPRLSRDMKESFDKVSEWWFKEVVYDLPSGRFMQLLTSIYSNALSRRLQTTMRTFKT